MNTTTCFAPAHILLPAEQIPLKQWGCIACDQFTSDREYWQRAKEAADGSPSTLNLILPEVAVLYVAEVLVLRFLLDDKQRTTEAQERTTEALAVKML